ncbi:MAG: iron-containing alcohol dehydrogenase [Halothiobacillaceae bacterium]
MNPATTLLPESFTFAQMPAIRFGWDITRASLDETLCNLVRDRLMLVAGGHADRVLIPERLTRTLAERRVHRVIVRQEPSPELIDRLVAEAPEGIEWVVGFGGGSVLDAAKAIAGLLRERHPIVDYLEGVGCGRKIQADPVPFLAVPTTAGTGSETTKNAVISRLGAFKKSFRDERLLARQAWLDPALLESCPTVTRNATAMDAFSQLLESYVTHRANPMTDALALQGLSLFLGALEALEDESQTVRRDALGRLMLAASLSGMTLANAGLGAIHGLAGPIGAHFAAPHGEVCARLLAPVTAENIAALAARPDDPQAARALVRYRLVARLMLGRDDLDALIATLREMTNRYVPQGLARDGLTPDNLQPVIDSCRAGSMLGNPIELSDEALYRALRAAL